MNWTDSSGNFWLFGGEGLTSSFPEASLNDLWRFVPSINQWTWIGGSSSSVCLLTVSGVCVSNGQLGSYGTLGAAASSNILGSRLSGATWTDNKGNLWLFGGFGYDADGNSGYLNDLWEYDLAGSPSFTPAAVTATPAFSLAAGTYSSAQTLTITDQTSGATIYYTTNNKPPNSSSSVYTGQIAISGSETVQAIAVAGNHAASGLAIAPYVITLPQTANPSFSPAAGTYTAVQTVSISDATAGATIPAHAEWWMQVHGSRVPSFCLCIPCGPSP